MSFAVDVNLLLYASDQGSPDYVKALRFLRDRAAGSEVFYLAWVTIMSYIRIATHPSIFKRPLLPEEALRNMENLLRLGHVRVLTEQEGFLDVYREVSGRLPVRGNLVPDAHLASLLKQHDVRVIYTSDTDFRKFDFLDVRDPFV